MTRWNDPKREENAEALRRRLAASRDGRSPVAKRPGLVAGLLVVGALGLALIFYALR